MTREAWDSTTMDEIPLNAQIVMGYPHAYPVDYARFPKALQVKIDQHGNHADDCHIADSENGAIGIGTIRQWVQSWHLLHPNGLAAVNGYFDVPTVYFSLNNMKDNMTALVGLVYDVWVGDWGVGPTVIPGTSLHQYENATLTGRHADLSVVYDPTWGIRPTPVKPDPVTKLEVLAYIAAHLS